MAQRCLSSRFATGSGRALCLANLVETHLFGAAKQTCHRREHNARLRADYSATALDAPFAQRSQRVYADFSIYKGKGALKTTLISPTWRSIGAGGDQAVDRQGSLLLEFAEPLPSSGSAPGDRRYDWENKKTFSLSAIELGALMDPNPDGERMYHDPNKGRSNEGVIQKVLSISAQDSGWYFGLQVKDQGQQSKLGVSISRPEMAVLKSLSQHLIPHLLGFDEAANALIAAPGQGGFAGSETNGPPDQPPF